MKDKFVSLKEWLKESETEEKQTYGCVMLDAVINDWEENHLDGIDEKDVYVKPYDDSYGLEENPHITIVYGIHEDEIDPQVVYDMMEQTMHPIKVMIGEIGMFETPEYDVVKYDVPVTAEIQKLRNIFMKFPNTQTFPEYHPHITIAYVNKGAGKKYAKKLEEPFEVTFNKGVYSWHENKDGKTEQIRKQYVFSKKEAEEQQ